MMISVMMITMMMMMMITTTTTTMMIFIIFGRGGGVHRAADSDGVQRREAQVHPGPPQLLAPGALGIFQ